MKLNMVLTGVQAGKTVTVGGYQFANGVRTIFGNKDVLESQIRILGRCYSAYPEGSPELKSAQARDVKNGLQRNTQASPEQRDTNRLLGGVNGQAGPVSTSGTIDGGGSDADESSDGSEGSGAGGGGHENSGLRPEQVAKIREALRKLDPNVGGHWNIEGLPSVEKVAELLGDNNVTRAMISYVEPALNRESLLADADI